MPGWVEDLLKEMFYGPFYQLAKVVWDWCIGLSTGVISQDPQHFSPATWKFVTDTLYPWAMGIGLSMMNVFFICVFLKAASNLKENITLELCIEGMIRLVALNVLMQMGMQLMKTLFSMASLMEEWYWISRHQIFSPAKWMPEVFCSGGSWDFYISLSH